MQDSKAFLQSEAIGGLLLIAFAIIALIISNSPWAATYHHILNMKFSVLFGNAGISKPIILWINDGLMALFFLLIGLELKRELLTGELREYDKLIMPLSGALGGIVVPIAFFYYANHGHPESLQGWAIPMATDIAFALGVLALFGKRVPTSLKMFLMTLAIIDDLAAILVIAFFHTSNLSWYSFIGAFVCLLILLGLNFAKIGNRSSYILVGLIMWICVLKSGFHATLAGIVLALTIPMQDKAGNDVLADFEKDLHGMVAFFILPIFAFANAGVTLSGFNLKTLGHPLIVGNVLGLVAGKVIGVALFAYLTKKIFQVKTSFTLPQLIGVAALCGIGFTMSLFIAGLSFGSAPQLLDLSRLSILIASLVSMVIGVVILSRALPKQ